MPAYYLADYTWPSRQSRLDGPRLIDNKARFYDPTIGRFVQPDTLISSYANPQTLNRYSYVNNRPILLNDPTGYRAACGIMGETCHDEGRPKPVQPWKTPPTSDYRPRPSATPPVTTPNPTGVPSAPGVTPTDVPAPPGVSTPAAPSPAGPGIVCSTPVPGSQNCWEPDGPAFGFTIGFKSWSDIDKVDLTVDVLGIVGDVALLLGGPPGAIAWVGTEALELMTIGKAYDQLEMGDPSGVTLDTIVSLAQGARLIPEVGAVGNLVGIGSNVLTIKTVP